MTAKLPAQAENKTIESEALSSIKLLAKNTTFDELPCLEASMDDIDWKSLEQYFSEKEIPINHQKAKNLGIITTFGGVEHPSNAGILLFGKNRSDVFPDAVIRCVRFIGTTKEETLDHTVINNYLPNAIDDVMHFVRKNTFMRSTIGEIFRVDEPQFPIAAVREAITNAVVHTDYAITGSSIIVTIFDDYLEITNPGALPYGISLEDALAGSSKARNRVIARTFHRLNLIEQWGSGLQKIIQACAKAGLVPPKFEELGMQFRVTVYSTKIKQTKQTHWQKNIIETIDKVHEVSTNEAAQIWHIDTRSARRRLKKLLDEGIIERVGTSKTDPNGKYIKVRNAASRP